jgi:predicted transcriptional regulator
MNVNLPCEKVARDVLPAFRSLIARGLIEDHGFTQTAVAERLGSTQAAISHYLLSKRGETNIKRLKADSQIVLAISELVNELANGTLSTADVAIKLCEMCGSLRNRGIIVRWNSPSKLGNNCVVIERC